MVGSKRNSIDEGVIMVKFKMGVGELDSELGGKTKFQEIGSVYGFRLITR